MKWVFADCTAGDMVRVRIGSVYHYGIYASDDEVIQFGLPPIDGVAAVNADDVRVCSTDIYQFSCGGMVEVGRCGFMERIKRNSPRKTVALAKSRLGEGGYNLIHNNCEHFAYECVFGQKRSTQEDDARKKWQNRHTLCVYLAAIPQDMGTEPLVRQRNDEINSCTNDDVKREKYWVWKLLEKALGNTFGMTLTDDDVKKNRHGKWESDKVCFSLSHSKGIAAVAVSDCNVGVDVENVDAFVQKLHNGTVKLDDLAKKALNDAEHERFCANPTAEEFLAMWTKKESVFKYRGKGSFAPRKTDVTPYAEKIKTVAYNGAIISVCCDHVSNVKFYFYDGTAKRVVVDESFT